MVEVFVFCSRSRDLREVVSLLASKSGCTPEVAEASVAYLLENGLLHEVPEEPVSSVEESLERWTRYGWREPFHFQMRTNLLPKTDYSEDRAYRYDIEAMKRKLAAEPQPPANYKEYPDACSYPLELANPPDRDRSQTSVRDIVSEIQIGSRAGPLSYADFSRFTYLAYGQTAVRKLPVTGEHVGKTSPSGGSRHPTEVYPVVLSVESVPAGLYHYNVRHNALELLDTGDQIQFLREHVFLSPQRPPFAPSVVFLFTTIFERSMFRYRDPRSYRVIHFDLGHLMQTSAFLAVALDRCSYRAYTIHDSVVDTRLGIDGLNEASMAFFALG